MLALLGIFVMTVGGLRTYYQATRLRTDRSTPYQSCNSAEQLREVYSGACFVSRSVHISELFRNDNRCVQIIK